MRRRKHSKGKLAAAVLILAAMAALLLVLPARMPEPESGDGPKLAPVGAVAGRKNIYDRRLRELAVSLRLTSVYAKPLELRDPEMIAGELATILERDEKELLSALRSERGFVWLGRRLDAPKAERVAALEAKGLYFVDEEQRFYPHRDTAAHVIGFLSNDQGLAGIEFQYERLLQGGWHRDGKLAQGPQSAPDTTGEKEGVSLVLTLDLDLQGLVERELARARQETGAAAAMALVMEPGSGEIHALVNLPAFDPNRFWEYSAEERRNRVLADGIRPGGLWNLFRNGHRSQASVSVDGGESPVAALPRQQAESKPVSLHPDWNALGNGVYVSPALADLGPAPEAGEIARLLPSLETATANGIDLPREPGSVQETQAAGGTGPGPANLSALQLLTAFNRAASAGATGPPHLLKALWPADDKPQAVDYKQLPSSGSSAQGAATSVLQQGGDQAGTMFESLTDLAPPDSAAEDGAPAEGCRRQDVLLGVSEGERPFTFLLVLDGACIDPAKPALLRQAGRRLLQWLATPRAEGPATPDATHPEKLVGQWRQVHDPAAPGNVQSPLGSADLMPDVQGMSLRQALQELQPYGLPIAIEGSGRVTGQEPQAGAPLKGVGRIRLELKAK